jgi:hypothetical protein
MFQASRVEWRRGNLCGESSAEEVITIVTSLAPGKNLYNQRMAIDSWIQLGFKVVAVNARDEITVLEGYFPDIEFVEAKRDGREVFSKAYIYFDDFLAYFATCNTKICGIVNSDIHLLKKEFYDFVAEEAIHSFIYGSRVDVKSIDELQGHFFNQGFDYFFFDKEILPCYPPSNFLIGLPMWDFWAVLVPLCIAIKVKKVTTPHAYHILHQTNWDHRTWQVFRDELLNYIKPTADLSIGQYPLCLLQEIANGSALMEF